LKLDLDQVAKIYPDGTRALAGVSFTVPSGQFCVLLGASGSGKSTLIRCINGLAVATSGAIRAGDALVSRATLRDLRREIGSIHQTFALTPRASVAANIIVGALPVTPGWRALTGWFTREQKARACTLAAAVGLEERHLRRRALELSGGQQQRVGIARAFMLSPRLVLADEPVASLDPKTSIDILQIIRAHAQAAGATVLCSLHQLDLARQFADRIIALRAGEIVFDGPPASLTEASLRAIYGASAAQIPA